MKHRYSLEELSKIIHAENFGNTVAEHDSLANDIYYYRDYDNFISGEQKQVSDEQKQVSVECSNFFARVKEWNDTKYSTEDNKGVYFNAEKSKKLLLEEVKEASVALKGYEAYMDDKHRLKIDIQVHLLKELFDICFVTVGIACAIGLDSNTIAKVFDAGCDSNFTRDMTKLSNEVKGSKGPNFIKAESAITVLLKDMYNESR